MKPTFRILTSSGIHDGRPTSYTPIKVDVGLPAEATFALHIDRVSGSWIVSDPITGGRMLKVVSTYKGMPVSSEGEQLSVAKRLAVSQLTQFISRTGCTLFNARLAELRARYGSAA